MDILSVIFFLIALPVPLKVDTCLIIQEKSITIKGNTSIGGFSCDYEISGENDTLHINGLSSSSYSFVIPVKTFRCGNFLLNRDFQATLKAEDHPKISVDVLNLRKTGKDMLTGNLRLSIGGKSKILRDVSFCLNPFGDNQILTTDFLFYASEFELTPPKKLGGLIKADDVMDITVSLVLKPAVEQNSYSANE